MIPSEASSSLSSAPDPCYGMCRENYTERTKTKMITTNYERQAKGKQCGFELTYSYMHQAFGTVLNTSLKHIPVGNQNFAANFSTSCSSSSRLNWFSLRRTMNTNNNKKPYTKRYIKKHLKPVECRFFSLCFSVAFNPQINSVCKSRRKKVLPGSF